MRIALLCLAALAIAACGNQDLSSFAGNHGTSGSGGGTGAGGAGSEAAGLWWGTLEEDGTTVNYIFCLITSTGQVGCDLSDGQTLMPFGAAVGAMTTGGIAFSGDAFTTDGGTFADGSELSEFSGTVTNLTAQSTLEGTVTLAGHQYTLTMAFDGRYNNGSSLAKIGGVYQTFSFADFPASLSIDANGELYSQNVNGCVASGSVAVIDPSVNEYSADLTISNCSYMDGDYSGVVIQEDTSHFEFILFGTSQGLNEIAGK